MSEENRKQQEGRHSLTDVHKVALVGVHFSGRATEETDDHLNELAALAETYGFEVVKKVLAPIKEIKSATYIGHGKAEEIGKVCEEEGIDAVIFDDEITPNQQKNLEECIKKPVLCRTELILEVFAKGARTNEAKLQIELAQAKYQLPRLKRMWTHLSRQRMGGSGGGALRGSGEQQIEFDRRLIKSRIGALEKEIKAIALQRETQRSARIKTKIPTFAIVGYTNVGKSTLLNALTHAGVLEENKLFATLDTTARQFTLPNHQKIVLIDTVGFIRKLPHNLVAAFKSTLEEACYTDILLHVVDVSHKEVLKQAATTMEVLKELGATSQPIITVLNKVDLCEDLSIVQKLRLLYPKTVAISAKTREGFETLLEMMMKELQELRMRVHLRIPQSHYALASELIRQGNVLSSEYEGEDILLDVEIPKQLEHKVRSFYDANPS